MNTVQIGQITLPAIGIGTWHIGDNPQEHASEVAAIRAALDHGATAIDTAEMYGRGRAEAVGKES